MALITGSPPAHLLKCKVEERVLEVPLQDVMVRPRLHCQQPVDLAGLQRVAVRAHQEEAAQMDSPHLSLTELWVEPSCVTVSTTTSSSP